MLEKLRKATPLELEVWMISATIAGIGFGALLANSLSVWAMPIFIASLAIHICLMIRIYSK